MCGVAGAVALGHKPVPRLDQVLAAMSTLIAHRGLDDPRYVAALEEEIKQNRWDAVPTGVPADWAVESFLLAKAALLPPHANVDEAYYRAQIPVIDKRLALAGLRLAALLNASFTTAPPVK